MCIVWNISIMTSHRDGCSMRRGHLGARLEGSAGLFPLWQPTRGYGGERDGEAIALRLAG